MNAEITILKNRLLFRMARMDAQYAAMSEEYRKFEEAFGKLISKMTDEEQDIAWGFVCTSDEMNWRMMELICQWFDIGLSDIVKKAESQSEL